MSFSLRRRWGLPALSLLALSLSWAGAATDAPPALEQLSFEASPSGVTVVLKASGPIGPLRFDLPSPSSQEVSIEFKRATSKLQARYALDGRILREAVVEDGSGTGQGPRLRLILARGVLAGFEQSTDGLVLRFQTSALDGGAGAKADPDEYKVGVGDKLEISVFGHEDLSKVVEVRGDGTIGYPLVGDIAVKGKTIAQIGDQITRTLGKDYLVDPQVSVDVREYKSQWVTVMGEVRTPGRFVLKRNMRVIDVLAEAGGVTKEAGAEIFITRRSETGETSQIVLDRERLLGSDHQDANILLSHMDIVTVGEKKIFYIRGEVTRPGSYFLESGLTLMKAISVAGGLTPYANRKEVQLIRSAADASSGNQTVVNLKAIEEGKKPDIPLLPNDVIIVPRRIF